MGNNNNNRKENNFFTQNLQRFGEDFMEFLNADTMQKAAVNVFRSLARGKINIDKHGKYFLEDQFLECCILAATSKFTLHSTNAIAVSMYLQNPNTMKDEYTAMVANYDKKCADAYSIILQNLEAIRQTKDVSYVYVMANNLRPYRDNI